MSNEYLEQKKALNQVLFSAKDFPSIYDSLLARLKEQYGEEYNDFASSSIGILFVNLMSYATSQLSWYLDRQASDTFLSTARTLSSATKLANQIGYKVKPASSSTVDLSLEFDPLEFDGTIPLGFKFKGPNNLTFSATNNVLIASGSTSVVINVSEGEEREVTFTSNGLENQIFQIGGLGNESYIADQSIRLYVNGQEWEEKDFLVFEKTNQFEADYTTSPPRVILGDGFAGNVPLKGSTLRIKYRVISGFSGNVKSGTITSATDEFLVNGEAVTFLSVNNVEGSSGGDNPESLESIKRNAPLVFQSKGSAVTQNDYDALINSFSDPTYGSVSKGYASVVRSTSLDIQLSRLISEFENSVSQSRGSITDINNDSLSTISAAQSVISGITGSPSSIKGKVDSTVTLNDDSKAIVTEISNRSSEVEATCTSIDSRGTSLIEQIVASTISVGLVNSFTNTIEEIKSDAQRAKAKASQIGGFVTTVLSNCASIKTSSNEVSVEALGIETAIASVSSDLNIISSNVSNVASLILEESASMTTNKANLTNYLNGLFSNDCKSNLVKVPILVKGGDGFYRGASSGLVYALQSYLDDRKEITHVVSVFSGEHALVNAEINVNVKINSSYVVSEIRANIESGINELLKDRAFNEDLYLSDLYSISEAIDGIDYINIEILGPNLKLDQKGNLIVNELEIISKGSLAVTEV